MAPLSSFGFGRYQLLRKYLTLDAKCSTLFTFSLCLSAVWCCADGVHWVFLLFPENSCLLQIIKTPLNRTLVHSLRAQAKSSVFSTWNAAINGQLLEVSVWNIPVLSCWIRGKVEIFILFGVDVEKHFPFECLLEFCCDGMIPTGYASTIVTSRSFQLSIT